MHNTSEPAPDEFYNMSYMDIKYWMANDSKIAVYDTISDLKVSVPGFMQELKELKPPLNPDKYISVYPSIKRIELMDDYVFYFKDFKTPIVIKSGGNVYMIATGV